MSTLASPRRTWGNCDKTVCRRWRCLWTARSIFGFTTRRPTRLTNLARSSWANASPRWRRWPIKWRTRMRRCQGKEGAASESLGDFGEEPGASVGPPAFGGRLGDAEGFGGFLKGQAGEEAEFDQIGFLWLDGGKFV